MILLKIFIYLTTVSLVITVLAYLLRSWQQLEDATRHKVFKLPPLNQVAQFPELIKQGKLYPIFDYVFVYGFLLCAAFMVLTLGSGLILLAEAKTGYYLIGLAILVVIYFYIARKKKRK